MLRYKHLMQSKQCQKNQVMFSIIMRLFNLKRSAVKQFLKAFALFQLSTLQLVTRQLKHPFDWGISL